MLAYFLFSAINYSITEFDFLTRSILKFRDLHIRTQRPFKIPVRRIANHVRVLHLVVVHMSHASTRNFEVFDDQQRQALVDTVKQVLLADELHVGQIVLGEVLSVKNAVIIGCC